MDGKIPGFTVFRSDRQKTDQQPDTNGRKKAIAARLMPEKNPCDNGRNGRPDKMIHNKKGGQMRPVHMKRKKAMQGCNLSGIV
jgi:hypothetical protein